MPIQSRFAVLLLLAAGPWIFSCGTADTAHSTSSAGGSATAESRATGTAAADAATSVALAPADGGEVEAPEGGALDAGVIQDASGAAVPSIASSGVGSSSTALIAVSSSSAALSAAPSSSAAASTPVVGADETVCGAPGDRVQSPELGSLAGCTRFRGSVFALAESAEGLAALTELRQIDETLLLVSPPEDLSGLGALVRVGKRLSIRSSPEWQHFGLEQLEEVGDLWFHEVSFTDFSWLPKLRVVNGSFIVRRPDQLAAEAFQVFADSLERVGPVSISNVVVPELTDPNAVVCGAPEDHPFRYTELVGCTRFLGSIHMPDISVATELEPMSSLTDVDGAVSVFRNHTTDFTALALRRVGTLFSVSLPDTSLQGFETLEEVGELSLRGSFQDLAWLSGLKRIRETATIEVSEELSEAEIRAFLAGVDVAGDAVVYDLSLLH